MRALAWVGVFLLCSVLGLGGLLFTKAGNTILLPFAQSALNHSLPFQTQLQTLAIKVDSIYAELVLNKTLAIVLEGRHSLGRKLDIQARIHFLHTGTDHKESAPLGYLHIQGDLANYTIQSTNPQSTNPHSPTEISFALFARMKFLSIQEYTLELRAVPMEQVARFFDIDINAKGTLSILAQEQSQILQLRLQSDKLSLGALDMGINTLYYKRDSTHQELAGTFSVGSEIITALGKSNGKEALQSTLYSSHQAPMASAQTQILDNALAYSLHISDLGAFGSVFGFDIQGELELQGKISADNGIAFSAASSSLGGESTLTLEKNILKFSGENLSLMRILQLLKAPTILESSLMVESVYNLAFHKGTINIEGQNFAILLDDLGAFGLEAFDTQDNAQDAWGVGFDTKVDSSLVVNGQIERAQITAQATIKSQDQSLRTSKCTIDLATQSLDVEFLESAITLQGKLSQMQAPQISQTLDTPEAEDLQTIYETQDLQENTKDIEEIQGI